MKVTAITQARSGSSRLPEKIFKEIQGKSILQIHLDRVAQSKRINEIIVATTLADADLRVSTLAATLGLKSFRGSENDVLDRFYQSVQHQRPDYIVRVTSDCPLLDPALIDLVIERAITSGAQYCSNILKETFPDGQDIEVFTFEALETAWKEATLLSEREHVTPYIRKNCDYNGGTIFKSASVESDGRFAGLRMTVDEQADFDVIEELVLNLGTLQTWEKYADYMLKENLSSINASIKRNEGYAKSLKRDKNL